jgi:hypothetical protein
VPPAKRPGTCEPRRDGRAASTRKRALTTTRPSQTTPTPRGCPSRTGRKRRARSQPWARPVFCWRCTAVIRRELVELEDLAARAHAAADGYRAAPGGERVSGSPPRAFAVPVGGRSGRARLCLAAGNPWPWRDASGRGAASWPWS